MRTTMSDQAEFVNSSRSTENQSPNNLAGSITLHMVASLCFKEIPERLLLLK